MYSRREFLGTISRPAAASVFVATFNPYIIPNYFDRLSAFTGSAEDFAADESMWADVQQAFTVDRTIINLNNGGVSPSPSIVQEAMKRHLDYSNEVPVKNMWEHLEPQQEGVR